MAQEREMKDNDRKVKNTLKLSPIRAILLSINQKLFEETDTRQMNAKYRVGCGPMEVLVRPVFSCLSWHVSEEPWLPWQASFHSR